MDLHIIQDYNFQNQVHNFLYGHFKGSVDPHLPIILAIIVLGISCNRHLDI